MDENLETKIFSIATNNEFSHCSAFIKCMKNEFLDFFRRQKLVTVMPINIHFIRISSVNGDQVYHNL